MDMQEHQRACSILSKTCFSCHCRFQNFITRSAINVHYWMLYATASAFISLCLRWCVGLFTHGSAAAHFCPEDNDLQLIPDARYATWTAKAKDQPTPLHYCRRLQMPHGLSCRASRWQRCRNRVNQSLLACQVAYYKSTVAPLQAITKLSNAAAAR